MINQEVYAACKKLVDDDKGYEALACLSKMLEERHFVGGSEDWWDMEEPNYCPNCGADMRGDEV